MVLAQSLSHLFFNCSAVVSLWHSLFGIFDKCVWPSSKNQVLRLASMVLGEEKRLNFYDSLQSMLQCGVFGWSKTLIYLRRTLWDKTWYGIWLTILCLFGAKLMVFYRGFSKWYDEKLESFATLTFLIFPLFLLCFLVWKDSLSSLLCVILSLHSNKILFY